MPTAHKKIIQRYYSKRAHDYDKQKARTWKSELGFEAKILNEAVNAVSQVKDGLVLEVGVGSGRVMLPLMKGVASQFIGHARGLLREKTLRLVGFLGCIIR